MLGDDEIQLDTLSFFFNMYSIFCLEDSLYFGLKFINSIEVNNNLIIEKIYSFINIFELLVGNVD